ncbi:hypothetical protein DW025_13140 [Coprococcus sp. AF38-1]|uniref:hypothetical protein n=1 Tax=Coprococcus sp. AF38-1 TaxID=2302943 RepID=UPI000E725ADB|nr:hypothetical protein [Coprococcus sp. AF38-1]RJW74535.1 hypothetical protein DW025_13140 [Coprococcus sp. AF38-1]
MSGKYVRVDDVMELINTSNRGTCDYFIVDQIEELCSSEKIYDVDAVVEQLENERKFWENAYDGNLGKEKARSYGHAIEIVKGGGVDVN